MKATITLILGIFLFGYVNSFAQNIDYGIRVSSNWGQQIVDDAAGPPGYHTSIRQDYAFAIILDHDVNRWFSVSAEPGISFRGNDGDFWATTESGTFNSRLDYFSLPILAKIKLLKYNHSPYVEVGPRMDALLHKRYSGNVPERYKRVMNDYKELVFGGSTGIGFETSFLKGISTDIGIRLNFDFTNSYDNKRGLSVKNHANEMFISFQIK